MGFCRIAGTGARGFVRCLLVLSCCLAFAAGCSRKPVKPTSPQPPRPQVAADGQLKSLLGNAVLSNALLSYKMQCTEPTLGARVCHMPPEMAQRHAVGGT